MKNSTYIDNNLIIKDKTKLSHIPNPTPSYEGTFLSPSNLNLEELLKTNGKKQRFYFHYLYIISTIILLRVINKKISKDDFIPLNYKTLINIITKRKAKEILNDLKNWGIIESDSTWIKGIKSTGYKLNKSYLATGFKKVKVTDKLINKKMNNLRLLQQAEAIEAGADYHHLYSHLLNVKIDYKAALDYIEKNYLYFTDEFEARKLQIELINDGNLFFKVDKKGKRAHTNLTNLSSDLRQFITYKGAKLAQIDMKNSQPFLLNLLIKDKVVTDEQRMEYKKFKELTEHGRFYEFLMEKFDVEDVNRKEFKVLFFGRVFFDVNRQELKKEEKMFQQLFPNIFGWIREMKKEDYTQLAIKLQRAESNVIISECIRRIRKERPAMFVSTIHDSIVCQPNNLMYVKQVMEDVFELNYNLKPSLKQELF